jgi:Uma2 family endonuclease
VKVAVEEYLSTAYHPDVDVDYVGGHIEERNVGEKEHGKLQFRITLLLKPLRKVVPFIDTRLRIAPDRYRVPDVCAYEKNYESIFTKPPVLCIEILSPEDRMSRVLNVVQDYLSMDVATVWVLDPLEKKAYVADAAAGFREVDEIFPTKICSDSTPPRASRMAARAAAAMRSSRGSSGWRALRRIQMPRSKHRLQRP